jgi:hypothetical protein
VKETTWPYTQESLLKLKHIYLGKQNLIGIEKSFINFLAKHKQALNFFRIPK